MCKNLIVIDIMTRYLKFKRLNKNYKELRELDEDYDINFKIIFDRDRLSSMEMSYFNELVREYRLVVKHIGVGYVDMRGKCLYVKNLFGTEISLFESEGKLYYSNVMDIFIPVEWYFVKDVIGLNNVARFDQHYVIPDPNKPIKRVYNSLEVAGYYDFPERYTGANRVIALIELGGGYLEEDLDFYFKEVLKLPFRPVVIPMSVQGAKNNPADKKASVGVTMDIEIIGAIAYCSTILVYFAPNSELGFYEAFYAAINNLNFRPSVIVTSWGCPETKNTPLYMESFNSMLGYAAKYNMNIFVSSGDKGSSDGTNMLVVDFPASSPNVIACGGTTLDVEDGEILSEVVWSGSGGGFSNYFAKPDYQKFVGTKRGVPDIAANSDPLTGYLIYVQGNLTVLGGTGAAACIYGAMGALFAQPMITVKYINPYIYDNAELVCYDIVEGSNGPDGKYDAGVGWDACTGNGRVYGKRLLESLVKK